MLRVVTMVAWVALLFATPTVAPEGVSGFAFSVAQCLVWAAGMIAALAEDGFTSVMLRTFALLGAFASLTMVRAKLGHPPDAYLAFGAGYVATGLGALLGVRWSEEHAQDDEEPGEP